MRIPSDIKYVRKASAEIEKFLKSNSVDEASIFDIRLSAEEAIKNAIIHGNKKNRKLGVLISYSLKGDKFSLEVEDEGEGFDPEKLPDPTSDENILKAMGRGVFLIRKVMDKVEYNDRGNKIFMIKYVQKGQRLFF